MILSRTIKFISLVCVTFFIAGSASSQNTQPTDLLPKIELPGLKDFTNQNGSDTASATARQVLLEAVLLEGGDPIENGLIWRVFDPNPGEDGKYKLVAAAEGGSTVLDFEPGDYFIHVAFGRAGVTKRLSVTPEGEVSLQRFILDAGGIILKAISGDNGQIPDQRLRFSIYSGEDQNAQDSDRQLVLENVGPNKIIRLNEGTYHVVSRYGKVNAVTRADVRVIKGQLTEVLMQHRAAEVTFKLVSKSGGEGIADTAWSVYSSSGDIIGEMVGAFPKLVLSEGDYQVIAIHQENEYPHSFHVTPGENTDVEVPLTN